MTSSHEVALHGPASASPAVAPVAPTEAPTTLATAQTEWFRVLAETLRQSGVTQTFVSPGSRSTPVLAAFLRAGLVVTDVIDERAAAFVALGHARATGRPAAVLCTSGTAPAHWYPAVLEASLVEAPMVLISADRPTELGHCGAPQTLDQTKLFGEHVRFFADPGNPEAADGALAGLRRVVAQAVSTSRGPRPGPVHLNVRARKPLEPVEATTPHERALASRVDALLSRPLARTESKVVASLDSLEAVSRLVSESTRVLVIAGPLPPTLDIEAVRLLVERSGAVLVAESTSQLRFSDVGPRCDALDLWLAAGLFSAEIAPDLVIELGAVPTSGAYERWVARARPRRVVIGVPRYVDPHASAEHVVVGDPSELARALAELLVLEPEPRRSFQRDMVRLEELSRPLLAAASRAWGEPAIARIVAAAVPSGGRLVVGNSLPIRTLDRHATRDLRREPLVVMHQRGANGIDGLLAQSAGAALADARPTVALLGDLTLLHDVGALAIARHVRTPLVIVVVDNAGGRIFEALPVARDAAWMMPHMTTSEPIDHGALARAFGVDHALVEREEALVHALARATARAGVTLVQARVEAHGAREADSELVRRATEELASLRRTR